VKTTLEIPDALFRKAKSTAAERGQTLKQFVTEAVQEKLAVKKESSPTEPAWMKFFGAGKDCAEALHELNREIEREFEQIEPEDLE
jgi:hypothetical protein